MEMTMLGLQRMLVAMLCVLVGLVVFSTFRAIGNHGACTVQTADGPARSGFLAAESTHIPVRPR